LAAVPGVPPSARIGLATVERQRLANTLEVHFGLKEFAQGDPAALSPTHILSESHDRSALLSGACLAFAEPDEPFPVFWSPAEPNGMEIVSRKVVRHDAPWDKDKGVVRRMAMSSRRAKKEPARTNPVGFALAGSLVARSPGVPGVPVV
jgi:hypothetical protein